MGLKIGSTTGYTDEMMAVVTERAKEQAYEPDCWFSPDAVEEKGRPYPYMVFRNMEALGLKEVSRVMKVGDTVADILEGKHAGLISVGILEGSSVLGLTEKEYENLSQEERTEREEKSKGSIPPGWCRLCHPRYPRSSGTSVILAV